MKWAQLDLFPPPADWWAHALPQYVARGGFDSIIIDPPEESPPGLERVTHSEVLALRGDPLARCAQ